MTAWAMTTLLVDQLAKWAVSSWLGPGESIRLVGRAVRLTHVTNPGAAFGLFRGRQEVFVGATLVVVLLAIALAVRFDSGRGPVLAGLGLAAGGAGGNLVDRLRHGAVLDFIDVSVWPVFNLADTAIVAGVLLLFLHAVRRGHPAPEGRGSEGTGL